MYNEIVNIKDGVIMDELNNLLQELGVSKVKLSKYLGVSRQMVYNYLILESLEKWPKEKKILLLQLLALKTGSKEEIKNIKVDTEYLMNVEKRLNMGVKKSSDNEYLDFKGLDKNSKNLLNNITFLLKEKLEENKDHDFDAVKYLYFMLQSMENVPEIKYIFAYMAKTNCFIDSEEYIFDENKQFIFEGILYQALNIYNNGGASKSKVVESRKQFVKEIERKKEEKLGRTQQLNTLQVQALKELGYNEMNSSNAVDVFEKMAEIMSRRV